jgi:RNA polymerase subunit RPABC4/transcription elongation factor Spt4
MIYEIVTFATSGLFLVVVLSYLAVFWLALTVWAGFDITRRTKSWLARTGVLALVGVSGIFGLAIYLILRPKETLTEVYGRRLEEKILERESRVNLCPGCQEIIEPSFTLCPYCKSRVKNTCPVCSELLDINWLFCPYCGHEEILSPRRGRGRPRKYPILIDQPKRPRGRPRKYPVGVFKVKRPRGRPRKIETPTATA